jgi:hypothetical protein
MLGHLIGFRFFARQEEVDPPAAFILPIFIPVVARYAITSTIDKSHVMQAMPNVISDNFEHIHKLGAAFTAKGM